MNENKILHVMILDKFLAPYIDFVDEHFGRDEHHYVFITSEKYEYGLTHEHKVEFLHTDDDIFITLLEYMKMSKKIILHGLWRDKVDVLLYFNQELLKKCYWFMWGGDFYFPETKSKIRHEVIKKMGYCVTANEGDFDYIRKFYHTRGVRKNCFIYPSNLFKKYTAKHKNSYELNIQLGNSATTTNNHIEILNKLAKYKDKNIKIFVPLSYGDKNYANIVINKGKDIFGEKFIALNDFIPFEKYLEFLYTIDIAIFAHQRQQALGNIVTLLGFGKKVYINKQSTLCKWFTSRKFIVHELEEIDNKDFLEIKNLNENKHKIKEYFSIKTLKKDLSLIFTEGCR